MIYDAGGRRGSGVAGGRQRAPGNVSFARMERAAQWHTGADSADSQWDAAAWQQWWAQHGWTQ